MSAIRGLSGSCKLDEKQRKQIHFLELSILKCLLQIINLLNEINSIDLVGKIFKKGRYFTGKLFSLTIAILIKRITLQVYQIKYGRLLVWVFV